MNTLTKVLMTLALVVVSYYLFIGLFYVVAAGVLLILALYGFSFVQKYWHRIFGGGDSSSNTFIIDVDSQVYAGRPSQQSKQPNNIKVIDIT